ncbi:MAG TPA: DUF1800 domain-containing protein [Tepidisphaeraceae bacterium]|nr:DUF1800 domain-containing protein [Tepidisphaeraceae bacterium]
MVSHRRLLGFVGACVVACGIVAVPLSTRADDDNPPPPHHKQPKSLQQRIIEAEAGIQDAASRPQGPQAFVGPDLSEQEKAEQVLNRMTFGATPGQVEEVIAKGGWQAWAKEQLDPQKIDDSACDKEMARRFPWIKMPILDIKKAYADRKDDKDKSEPSMRKLLPQLVLSRQVLSKRQFKEVMCEFWRNHFCVDEPAPNEEKSRTWTDADYEEQVIRKYCFGSFKDMLFASARHPAMLEYLDNKLSKANAWNENYAREVMELHTLGADQGYSNRDVQELSKVFTGWQYDANYRFYFNAKEHQPGPKHWEGMTIPQGYEGGEQALYTLATAPRTARFISTKLCKFLMNDSPSPALVRQVALVFRQTDGDLPKVYWAIISSRDFMSRLNYRAKFKTPVFFTVSALRATSAKLDSAAETCDRIAKMGEAIYNCPDPTGYRDVAESWMDAGVLTSRWQFSWDLMAGSVEGVKVPATFLARYKSLNSEAAEAKMIEDLIGGDVGDRELVALKEVAGQGDQPRMVSIILGSPSFQQR